MSPVQHPTAKQRRIYWEESEWERLSDLVLPMRLKEPGAELIDLTRRALEQFPLQRRRTLRTLKELAPLLTRLEVRLAKLKSEAEEAERLRQRHAAQTPPPDRETILQNLPDEELVRRYADRLLPLLSPDEVLCHFEAEELAQALADEQLMVLATRRLMGLLKDRPLASAPPPPPAPVPTPAPAKPTGQGRLPTVVVVGLKGDQWRHLDARLGNRARFHYIATERGKRSPIPAGADLYLYWARFSSHRTQEELRSLASRDRIICHHGGLGRMIEVLEARLNALLPQAGG